MPADQIRDTRRLIRELAVRHTVLMSSHILPEVESVCDRVLIIDRGAIVASDSPARLAGRLKAAREVVAEIRAAGGEAVANAEDVSDWNGAERMVQQALDTWEQFSPFPMILS